MLNVIVGNGDAHLKNWAFLYPDGRTAELSPLYDVLPTVLYVDGDNLGLNLGGNKDFERVTLGSFDRLAARTGYGVEAARKRAADAIDRIMDRWQVLRDYLSERDFKRLTARHGSLRLLTSRD